MRILLASQTFASLGGAETYLRTVAESLDRLGHHATIFTREAGEAADLARRSGLHVLDSARRLPASVDAVLVQDAATAHELAERYPTVPHVFVAHSGEVVSTFPPRDTVSLVVAMNDRVAGRVRATGFSGRLARLTQPIDIERFLSRPLDARDAPRRALMFGNYVRGERFELLARCCARLGIELHHVGRHGRASGTPEREIADADLVLGIGRCAIEAMAGGRAALVYGPVGTDGWVTPQNYTALEADGFSGRATSAVTDESWLERQLAGWTSGMGERNYDLALRYHDATDHAERLVGLLAEAGASAQPSVTSAADELARLVRLQWQADSRAGELVSESQDLRRRAEQAERERDELVAEIHRARTDAAATLASFKATRRYRLATALARPLESARAGRAAVTRRLSPRSARVRSADPVPFVIGVPRSGTTLLRLILNAHPQLAVPPETGFIPTARERVAEGGDPRGAFLDAVTGFETWGDLGIPASALERELRRIDPFDVGEAVRSVYRLYAARFGKARFGDKTPMYALHLDDIRGVLPEARFVHIIRDGRDVALSVRPLHFRPGDTIEEIAADWRHRIETARRQADGTDTYLELRYEDLLAAPEPELRRVCDFLDLSYDPALERFWEHAEVGKEEFSPRLRPDGSVEVASERRLAHHRSTSQPIATERAGRWRRELTVEEREGFERVAGGLLRELGYESG